MNALRSEIRILTSTKLTWWLALASFAFTALNVVLLVYLVPTNAQIRDNTVLLELPDYVTSIVAACGSASVFILLIGVLGLTGEYRHMTITATFLASPRRWPVLLSKAAVFGVLGALLGIVNFAVSYALARLTLAGKVHAPIDTSLAGKILLGVMLGFAIYAILGMAVGALLRNQIAAVIIALVWVLLVQPLLGVFFSWAPKWLPGGALDSILHQSYQGGRTTADLLPAWGGALVLIGYAVVLGAIAAGTTLRRDVT